VVDAVLGVRDAVEGALVVLRLEAEVALDHDDDGRVGEDGALVDAQDVALEEGELLGGFCGRIVSLVLWGGRGRAKTFLG